MSCDSELLDKLGLPLSLNLKVQSYRPGWWRGE